MFRPDDGVLDLGGQHLGDAVVDAVAASWPFFKRRLKRLHLGGNDITDEGRSLGLMDWWVLQTTSWEFLGTFGKGFGSIFQVCLHCMSCYIYFVLMIAIVSYVSII